MRKKQKLLPRLSEISAVFLLARIAVVLGKNLIKIPKKNKLIKNQKLKKVKQRVIMD